ncbi:MAG TPA: deoxyribose-phosphate aldolase [Puia sp.]|nr:deoxyribose-phosphate aldolase [Puia sp.]
MIDIASYIDHTILKPATTHMEIKKICEEAVQYGFAAVCIPPSLVTLARQQLQIAVEESILPKHDDCVEVSPLQKVATVIGFPFGYSTLKAKVAEVEQALRDGAGELDMVINLTALRAGDWTYLEKEIQTLTTLVHDQDKVIKVIIESGILTDEEIIHCCAIASRVGVDFVKTSTGYAEKGASIEAVRLIRQHLPAGIKIKASGGIRTYEFARQLIEAGADRLGCSASVEIAKGQSATTKEY